VQLLVKEIVMLLSMGTSKQSAKPFVVVRSSKRCGINEALTAELNEKENKFAENCWVMLLPCVETSVTVTCGKGKIESKVSMLPTQVVFAIPLPDGRLMEVGHVAKTSVYSSV
jgi:hypothetical protein